MRSQAGIIHRDVKPSNLMVDSMEHCWVVDFGLASVQAAANDMSSVPVQQGSVGGVERLTDGKVGTRVYMAPEQHDGRARCEDRCVGAGRYVDTSC